MDRRKLPGVSLFFLIFGTLLLLPPLVLLFNLHERFFGIPLEVIYLFTVWFVLVVGTAVFAYRLPHEGDHKTEDIG